MDDFKGTAARVKGMQTIEREVRAALKHCGIDLRPQDFAWNRNRPYEPVPEVLELSIEARGAPPLLQPFTPHEVEQCARGVSDPAVTAKIEALIRHLQELDGKKRND